MRHLIRMAARRAGRPALACVLLAAGVAAPVLLAAAPAQAVACSSGAVVAGTPCTLTGTLGVTAGTLNLTAPGAMAWSATVTGLNQQVVDTTAAQETYLVDDASGSAAGWHVTISATTFTTSGSVTLPNSGTFSTTGSVSSATATTAPTSACSTGATCTLPTDSTTYPVAITTATSPTAVTIYDTAASTGVGSIVIGGSTAANPVGWWLNLLASVTAGTYTSNITMEVISGP
jgi:hypothetical protein